MFTFLLTLLIIDALILSTVVLLQAGQGGGLASLGGGTTASVLGGRQASNLLTKATWWTGGIFMAISLILGVVSGGTRTGMTDVQRTIQEQQRQQEAAGAGALPQAPIAPTNSPPPVTEGGATPPTEGSPK